MIFFLVLPLLNLNIYTERLKKKKKKVTNEVIMIALVVEFNDNLLKYFLATVNWASF